MTIKWKTGADKTAVDVRVGGPGNNWKVLDPDGMIDAPSGGGRDRTTLWGRGEKYGLKPRGYIFNGNPHDWTFNISYPLTAQNFLSRIADCPFDVRARNRCDDASNMTSYSAPGALGYSEITNNDYSYSDPIAAMDGTDADVKRALACTATFEERYTKLAHDDITKQWFDADVNRVLNISPVRCTGDCGVAVTEEDWWIAVSDRDSTPGYSGNATARLGWTLDKGATWNSVPIDLFQAADATDVVFLGDRIVVFSADKAPCYASFTDIVNGVTAPNLWTPSTGFSLITAGNFPKAASAPNSAQIVAVGNGGRIWSSTDGGGSFTLIDAGATTSQNLNAVDFQDATLGYIGGNSGTLLRVIVRDNSFTISRIIVTDGTSTLSANINSVRTPPTRGSEVYVGTAGGEIWRSRNATATRPLFENRTFSLNANGSVTDMAFIGYRGDVLYVLQRNTNNSNRVLRDLSGGALGNDVEVIGDFNTPPNFGINSIGMANVNFGLTVGQIHEQYGFIGQIRPNTY